jgi:hypothetical protein
LVNSPQELHRGKLPPTVTKKYPDQYILGWARHWGSA